MMHKKRGETESVLSVCGAYIFVDLIKMYLLVLKRLVYIYVSERGKLMYCIDFRKKIPRVKL